MITIQNVGPFNQSPFGLKDYEVRINNELVATFRHKREEGLANCLWEAAKAVERKKWEKPVEDMHKLCSKPNKPISEF